MNFFSFSLTLDSQRFPTLPDGFAVPVDDTPQRFVEQAERDLRQFREGVVSISALDCNCEVDLRGRLRTFAGGYSLTLARDSAERIVVIVFDSPGLGETGLPREYVSDQTMLVSLIGQSEAEWFLCHLLQGLNPIRTNYL